MKLKIWDILNDGYCDIDKATDRVMRMRRNDASTVAFILRKIIYNGYYDPTNLTVTFNEDFVIPGITFDDIATISRFMNKKPFNHGFEGLCKISAKVTDMKKWQDIVEDEEGGEQ